MTTPADLRTVDPLVIWLDPAPDAPQGDIIGAMATLLRGIVRRRETKARELTDGTGDHHHG